MNYIIKGIFMISTKVDKSSSLESPQSTVITGGGQPTCITTKWG
jgi:hypothetical protein